MRCGSMSKSGIDQGTEREARLADTRRGAQQRIDQKMEAQEARLSIRARDR